MNNVAIVPTQPSVIVRLVMSPLSRILNPAVAKLAGRRFFGTVATIHHTGRRSGKSYMTSVGARVAGDVAIIPLTFGSQSDWVRNVCAAGNCRIRVSGKDHQAVRPQILNGADTKSLVRAQFNPPERVVFRVLGMKQFICLDIRPTTDQKPSATV
jgi:deazaflavin-dependent oxidoreductase (nitroreductase family)